MTLIKSLGEDEAVPRAAGAATDDAKGKTTLTELV